MLRIWFNRTYATNVHVLAMLRDNPQGRPVHLIGSHRDPDSPVLAVCDERYPEPEAADAEEYVAWAARFAELHRIDVFVPRAGQAWVSGARDRFGRCAVLAPPAPAIELFEDKAAAYAAAAADGLPVPPHRLVRSATELADAYRELRAVSERLCLKPASGAGGDGFRVITEAPVSLEDLLGPLEPVVSLEVAGAALDARLDVPPILVMPYLPGPEVSVDALADRDGNLLSAVGRRKSGRRRELVDDGQAREIARHLVERHGLAYLSNTQVRYWRGPEDRIARAYLLEVNTRISGGLFQTALAGVNLAWAAVQLALGEQPELPEPNFGAVYGTVSSVVEIPATRQSGGGGPAGTSADVRPFNSRP